MKKTVTIGVESVWLYSVVASYLMKEGKLPYHTDGQVELLQLEDEDGGTVFHFAFTWDEGTEISDAISGQTLH